MKPLTLRQAAVPILGEARLIELVHKLILLGARTQVIVGVTGICDKRVRMLTKALIQGELRRGPCQFPSAKFFVGAQRKPNPSANIHSSIFVGCYLNLVNSFKEKMQEGFLLAACYEAYREEVDGFNMAYGDSVLDINRCYALIRCLHRQEIKPVHCNCCHTKYLILNWYERDSLNCPICTKNAHRKFLAEISKQGGRRVAAA